MTIISKDRLPSQGSPSFVPSKAKIEWHVHTPYIWVDHGQILVYIRPGLFMLVERLGVEGLGGEHRFL